MEVQGVLLTFLAVIFAVTSDNVVLQPLPDTAPKRFLFHIPWACSVVHTNGDLIGPCAIIEEKAVIVSPDNLNADIAGSNPPKRYFQDTDEIRVHAGSNYMDPIKLGTRQRSRYIQTRRVQKFYVAFKRPNGNERDWDFRLNPSDMSEQAGAEYGAYGLAFNVGFLVLNEGFGRSPYVVPMLIKGPDLPGRTQKFKQNLEWAAVPQNTCVTYSWNKEKNRIRYHEVMYLNEHNCEDVYCNWRLSKCRQIPEKDHHLCFKSVKYADVCPNARGAALYCPAFDNSVLAILTTAPSCGRRHMPGVYTTLPMVIDLFEKIFRVNFEPEKRTAFDLYSLPQKNSDYEGISGNI